jgi:hypothetical protein
MAFQMPSVCLRKFIAFAQHFRARTRIVELMIKIVS